MTWVHAKNVYLGAGYLPRGINNLISLKISCNETPSVVWLLFPSGIAADALLFPQPVPRRRRRRLFARTRTSLILFAQFLRLSLSLSLSPIILPWLTANRRHWKTTRISFHALLHMYLRQRTESVVIILQYPQPFLCNYIIFFLHKKNL